MKTRPPSLPPSASPTPGGLGAVPEQDVAGAPTVGLLEAMGMAAGRDRIAAAYVTDFVDIFEFGLRRAGQRSPAD